MSKKTKGNVKGKKEVAKKTPKAVKAVKVDKADKAEVVKKPGANTISLAGKIKELLIQEPTLTSSELRPKLEKEFGETKAFQNHFPRYVFNCRVALENNGTIPAFQRRSSDGNQNSKSASKPKKEKAAKKVPATKIPAGKSKKPKGTGKKIPKAKIALPVE